MHADPFTGRERGSASEAYDAAADGDFDYASDYWLLAHRAIASWTQETMNGPRVVFAFGAYVVGSKQ